MKPIFVLFLLSVSGLAQQAPAPAPPADAKQLVREGIALYDAGKYDEAIARYRQALAIEPENMNARYELGLTYAAKGDYPACAAVLQQATASASAASVQHLVMLGNCLDGSGQRAKAIETYRRALQLAPDEPRVEYELGIALVADKKLDEARELLKKDVLARPAHANGRYVLAVVFDQQGFRVPAVLEYLHYLALDATTPRAAEVAGRVRELLGAGVSTKDGHNINVTVDPNARKEEGDYAAMDVGMGLAAAAQIADDPKSEFGRAQAQLGSVLAMFVEMTGDHTDYTAKAHRPFFAELQQRKLTDAYAAAALSTLHLDGSKAWLDNHRAELHEFIQWMAPQFEKAPAATIPVSRQ